jgi:hypothetical protein
MPWQLTFSHDSAKLMLFVQKSSCYSKKQMMMSISWDKTIFSLKFAEREQLRPQVNFLFNNSKSLISFRDYEKKS